MVDPCRLVADDRIQFPRLDRFRPCKIVAVGKPKFLMFFFCFLREGRGGGKTEVEIIILLTS